MAFLTSSLAPHPLFRAIDSDDGAGRDFTTVRAHPLFRVTIPLHPNVRLVDDSARRNVTVQRSVPPIANLALTAPYLQDARAVTLEDQIRDAIADHFEPGREPRPVELTSLRLFLSGQFYPQRLRSLLDTTDPLPKEPGFSVPAESPAALRGKLVFDRHCRSCHGGETGDRPASAQTPRFSSVFVSERNAVSLPPIRLEIRRPDGSVLRGETPDPGRVDPSRGRGAVRAWVRTTMLTRPRRVNPIHPARPDRGSAPTLCVRRAWA